MNKKNEASEIIIIKKLDKVISLMHDLIIIEGAKSGIKKDELRRLLGINMNRITRISRLLQK